MSIISDKSFQFAIRVVKLSKYLTAEKKEFILSKQLLRSGTSIGANISEGKYGESKKDFIHKHSIALKECNESIYWIRLLRATDYINEAEYQSIIEDAIQIRKVLIKIIKSSKTILDKQS
ncbi:four helix bundle protein [Flammeovirga aprica]|uniref:Four helix bundle protein n=1 Tax=Flammeovirga aprica JL-4 TaxID=694437 RepID=A0A7X9S0M1_9BACT|nr:four helix bundle protein [Flammeovirga aprica]NME72170.1 four helix bundle protein [Flammeovirga aprica JL-4]